MTTRTYRQIEVDARGSLFCVRLRSPELDDEAMEELGAELHRLIDEEGCRRLVVDFNSEDPQCLYSILLAKLIYLQRHLEVVGGTLALVRAGEHTRQLFRLTGLERYFHFYPDLEAALV